MRSAAPSLSLALIVGLGLGGCRAADNFRRLEPQAQITRDLAYAALDPRQALDVYAPRDAGPHAIVVFVHGGFWHAQDRRYVTPLTGLYANVGVALAAQGVVAVVPSYRLFPAVRIEAEVDDVISALAWAIAHGAEYGGDPSRIVLAGHSAGAHLVMTVATRPDLLRARGIDPQVVRGQIAMSGIYDVPGLIERADPDLRDVLLPLFGDEAARWSPLDGFGADLAPTLFVVGEWDYRSCLIDFERAQRRLRTPAARARFVFLERKTHAQVVLDVGTRRDVLTPRMVAFVEHVAPAR